MSKSCDMGIHYCPQCDRDIDEAMPDLRIEELTGQLEAERAKAANLSMQVRDYEAELERHSTDRVNQRKQVAELRAALEIISRTGEEQNALLRSNKYVFTRFPRSTPPETDAERWEALAFINALEYPGDGRQGKSGAG